MILRDSFSLSFVVKALTLDVVLAADGLLVVWVTERHEDCVQSIHRRIQYYPFIRIT